MAEVDTVPWRDTHRIAYFVKSGPGIESMTFARAVITAADPSDKRKVFCAFADEMGTVHVRAAGKPFTALAKRAIRSAQRRDEMPPCQGKTSLGHPCKAVSVTQWHDLYVCAMHDPEGKFCAENPVFRKQVLMRLRAIKKVEVDRLEDRLTALLLERFGPSKGKGVIG